MAITTIEQETQRAVAAGDVWMQEGFSGSVKSVEPLFVEVGDVFTFPNEIKCYRQYFGDAQAEYCFVTLESGQAKKFYPSTFTKTRRVANINGTLTDVRKYTTGSAAEKFREFTNVKDAMNFFKGKTCKVVDCENVLTLKYGTTETETTKILKIELVDLEKGDNKKKS